MSLIVTAVIAFALTEGVWRWVVIGVGLAWEAIEIALFLRWRGVKARMGHETLVGTVGKTITDCRPSGQAQIRGQIWRVTCAEGVDAGAEVRVTETDGLHLIVEPFLR